jgi:hypothetical protein
MGMREHSGSRPGSGGLGAAVDAQHACSATMLAAAMGVSGMCVAIVQLRTCALTLTALLAQG